MKSGLEGEACQPEGGMSVVTPWEFVLWLQPCSGIITV